jgi:replicative DNA helicase
MTATRPDNGPFAPPQNIDAEREMLGAVLAYYSPRIVAEIKATGIVPEDFYRFSHGAIYGAILAVDAAGDHVDMLAVSRALGASLEAAGGLAMLEFLLSFAVPHGVCERARMIVEDARWRERLGAAYEMIEACHLRDGEAFKSAATLIVSTLAVEAPTLRAA